MDDIPRVGVGDGDAVEVCVEVFVEVGVTIGVLNAVNVELGVTEALADIVDVPEREELNEALREGVGVTKDVIDRATDGV